MKCLSLIIAIFIIIGWFISKQYISEGFISGAEVQLLTSKPYYTQYDYLSQRNHGTSLYPRYPMYPSYPMYPRYPRYPRYPSYPMYPRYPRHNYNWQNYLQYPQYYDPSFY